jgi:hypothetical protein
MPFITGLSKAPFPWFGGKRKAAPLTWRLLGDVPHYVEPFAGTLAVLLERPHPCNRTYYSETVNDADGFIVNVWRAIQWSPEATHAASWPVSEADKQARQIACLKWRDDVMLDRLAGDATFHDPLIAGWWLYGVCCQIGAFSGDGPWMADPVTGRITKQGRPGVSRDLPNLSKDGQGVNRPQLREPGVSRDLPNLSKDGQGVNRPQLREPGVDDGDEFHPVTMPELVRWFRWLAARLRHVRIVNGDWARVVTTGAAHTIPVRMGAGPAGIFLDPPYANNERAGGLYGHGHDDGDITTAVRDWCATNGDNPRNRIVLAGYDTEHAALESHGWTVHEWFTNGYLTGGMGNLDGTSQQHRERLWASPHCLTAELDGQLDLLSLMEAE